MKYFVFTFVLLLVHQSCIDAKYVSIKDDSRGLWEDAQQALKELREKIDKLIAEALAELENLLEEIQRLAEKVIEETQELIHKEIEKVLKEIEKIKQEAEALGVNITECVEAQSGKIEELEERVVQELIECVTDKVHEAEAIITDTVIEIMKVVEAYKEIEENLQKCKTSEHELKCVADVIKDVADKTIRLPIIISQQVAKAKKLIESLQNDLTQCALDKLLIVQEEAAIILAEFAKCVNDKINGANTTKGLWEDAAEALAKLKEQIKKLIEEAKGKLKKIIEQLKEEANKIIEQAKIKIREEIEKILEIVDLIIEEAAAQGVDITECVEELQQKVKDLEEVAIKELVDCVSNEVDTAVQIVQDTIQEIGNVVQTIQSIEEKLTVCKATNDKECINEAIKEIVDLGFEIPEFIKKQIEKVKDLISKVQHEVKECVLQKVLFVKEEATNILKNFTQCARDKIQGNEN